MIWVLETAAFFRAQTIRSPLGYDRSRPLVHVAQGCDPADWISQFRMAELICWGGAQVSVASLYVNSYGARAVRL